MDPSVPAPRHQRVVSSLPSRGPDGLRERYRALLLHAWDRAGEPDRAGEGPPIARRAGALRSPRLTVE